MKHTTMFTLALMLLGWTGVEDLQAQDARSDVQTVLSRMAPNRQLPADLILTGQVMDPSGSTQPFRITIKGKDQIRYEVGAGTALVTTILSKGRGARQAEGKLEAVKPYSAMQRPALVPFLDLLAEADTAALEVTDRGAVPLGSVTSRRYTLKLADPAPGTREFGRRLDEEVDLYVDPATALVMRSERWLMTENSMDIRFRAITDFADYRNVEGLAIPFQMVTSVVVPSRRQPFRTAYTITNVVVNSSVPDSTFEVAP